MSCRSDLATQVTYSTLVSTDGGIVPDSAAAHNNRIAKRARDTQPTPLRHARRDVQALAVGRHGGGREGARAWPLVHRLQNGRQSRIGWASTRQARVAWQRQPVSAANERLRHPHAHDHCGRWPDVHSGTRTKSSRNAPTVASRKSAASSSAEARECGTVQQQRAV